MRVSMSAIGSLMLMRLSLPTGLDHARHFAGHDEVAKLAAPEAELAVDAARPAGDRAAVAQAHRGGVARQQLQLDARGFAVLVGGLLVVDRLEERGAPHFEFLDGLATLLVAVDDGEFGHGWFLRSGTGSGTRPA